MKNDSYIFSDHAEQQIVARKLDKQLIVNSIANPDLIREEDGLIVIMKVIMEAKKSYLLRIFIRKDKKPNLVITVYKTSKIKKYYESNV